MKQDPVQGTSKVAVTFEMSGEIGAEMLSVVGEFNAWNPAAAPMKLRKDGTWARTLRLTPGTYCYRYVTDRGVWFNDPAADGYEASGFGEDNSLVVVRA